MRAAGLLVAAALAGCTASPAAETERQASEPALAWQDAPGGGKVARTEFSKPGLDYRSVIIARCWPIAGKQDCLVATWTSIAGFSARRTTLATLPASQAALAAIATGEGYSCAYNAEHAITTETITGKRGRLVDRSWIPFSPKPSWTKGYVTEFLRDNGVDGSSWFRCVDLMRRLRDGSIEMVGTTAVSQR